MVTYCVKQNEIYTIIPTTECRIYNASGVQVATCPAYGSMNIKATTNQLRLSDDNAVIKKVVEESAALLEACGDHLANFDIHTTAAEKADCLNHIANSTVHVSALEKTNFSNHLNSTSLHLTSGDKEILSNSKVHYQSANLHLVEGERTRIANSALRTEDNNFMGESKFYAKCTFNHEAEFINTVTKSDSETLADTSILNRSESDARYAQKTYETKNAILITDSSGNVTASTVISVNELNTLNNNVTNLATKLADLEARLAALES